MGDYILDVLYTLGCSCSQQHWQIWRFKFLGTPEPKLKWKPPGGDSYWVGEHFPIYHILKWLADTDYHISRPPSPTTSPYFPIHHPHLSCHPILTTPTLHHPSHLLVAAMIFTVVCDVKPSNWFNSSNMVRCTSRTPHQWAGSRGVGGSVQWRRKVWAWVVGRWIDRVKWGT